MARIVCDLDGTVIDSAPDIRRVANAVLAEEGAGPITLDQTRDFVGEGVGVFVSRMRTVRDIPDAAQDRLVSAFVARYEHAVELTAPYPGVREALDRLAAAGHRLGLCTNKPVGPCRAVLAHLGLADLFEVILGGDSLPVRKPDPAPLQAAFDGLGQGRRIYVGDSDVDAETARRAGVPFLLFTRGYRKGAVADLPHSAAFDDWNEVPALVARHVA